jgi:hypothetical protein
MKALDKLNAARSNLDSIEQTIQAKELLFKQIDSLDDINIWIDASEGHISFSFNGDSALLAQIWRILRVNDYEPQAHLPAEIVTNFSTYWTCEGHADIWIHFYSTVCKRVPVGKRMVEETIYKIECEG